MLRRAFTGLKVRGKYLRTALALLGRARGCGARRDVPEAFFGGGFGDDDGLFAYNVEFFNLGVEDRPASIENVVDKGDPKMDQRSWNKVLVLGRRDRGGFTVDGSNKIRNEGCDVI